MGAVPTQTQISQAGVGMGAQVARGPILALAQALRIPWVACSNVHSSGRLGYNLQGWGGQGIGGGNLESKHNPHVPTKFKAPGSVMRNRRQAEALGLSTDLAIPQPGTPGPVASPSGPQGPQL